MLTLWRLWYRRFTFDGSLLHASAHEQSPKLRQACRVATEAAPILLGCLVTDWLWANCTQKPNPTSQLQRLFDEPSYDRDFPRFPACSGSGINSIPRVWRTHPTRLKDLQSMSIAWWVHHVQTARPAFTFSAGLTARPWPSAAWAFQFSGVMFDKNSSQQSCQSC